MAVSPLLQEVAINMPAVSESRVPVRGITVLDPLPLNSSPPGKRHCSTVPTSSPTTVTVASKHLAPPPVDIPAPASDDRARKLMCTPAKDPDAQWVRAQMAKRVKAVYCDFVREGSFMFTDVHDKRGFLTTPHEDPMGVIAAAISITRAIYTSDTAADVFRPGMYTSLEHDARCNMAAALFIAYKCKSEDSWQGGCMPKAMMSRFVTEIEYPDHYAQSKMPRLLAQAEVNLLSRLPILSLVDCNIHSTVEMQLTQMIKDKLLTATASAAVLSCFGYYHELVTCHTETELVEESCATYSIDATGMAFIAIGAASILSCTCFDHEDIPSTNFKFTDAAGAIASRILSAAVRKDIDRSDIPPNSVQLQMLLSRATILKAQKLLR